MAKTLVNGASEHAIWTWLKRICPLPALFNYGAISWSPIKAHDIGWNFEKFLIDQAGKPCKHYSSDVPAEKLRNDVATVLAGGCPRHDECIPVTSSASRR